MRRDLIRRLDALEAKRVRHGDAACSPVPDDVRRDLQRVAAAHDRRDAPAFGATARWLADGRIVGRGLLVPAPIAVDAWLRAARDQQAELVELEGRAPT